eukprot:3233941-Alexandrium_andersonii.AAC.1
MAERARGQFQAPPGRGLRLWNTMPADATRTRGIKHGNLNSHRGPHPLNTHFSKTLVFRNPAFCKTLAIPRFAKR